MGTIHKDIHWRKEKGKGGTFAEIHVLEGYNENNLARYKYLARIIRKDFPMVKESEIKCSIVTDSDSLRGCLIVACSVCIPKKDYPGWDGSDYPIRYSF